MQELLLRDNNGEIEWIAVVVEDGSRLEMPLMELLNTYGPGKFFKYLREITVKDLIEIINLLSKDPQLRFSVQDAVL